MKATKEGKEMEIALISPHKVHKEKRALPDIKVSDLLIRSLGFFAARAVPLPQLAPFGLAFLAMDRNFSVKNLWSLLMVIAGYASLMDGFSLRYIGACLAFEVMLFFLDRGEELSPRSALTTAGTGIVVFHLLEILWTGFVSSAVITTVLDFFLVSLGVLVFDRSRGMMNLKNLRSGIPTEEEKLSLCITAGIVLLSFQSIAWPPYFSLSNFLGFWVLGIAAISGGFMPAAAAGMVLGLLLGIREDLLAYLAVFTFCGLLCGMAARFHKLAAAAVIALGGVFLSLYGMTGGAPSIPVPDPLLGAAALIFTPKRVFYEARRFVSFSPASRENDTPAKQRLLSKLSLTADSFETLSNTFVRLSDNQDQVDMQDIAMLFDTAADHICRDCSRVHVCWNKNFNATYKTMFKFLEIMERKGALAPEDIDPVFSDSCLRLAPLTRELNRLFEIYKINQVWKGKLRENRDLISQQFHGVSEILYQMTEELKTTAAPDYCSAQEIQNRLKQKGCLTDSVLVMHGTNGRQTVQITPYEAETPLPEETVRILNDVLGKKFVPDNRHPSLLSKAPSYLFLEEPPFTMEAAFACAEKGGECGDSYMLRLLNGGKYIATLSDGMGTGHRANRESSTIISLLEDFMNAGFDKTVAVKLINSVMVMKSAAEAFATVDMCMVDLYTGEAEFIKNGAEPSYIKRKQNTEIIRSASLPVGILSGVEIETFAHTLKDGDMVIMASDGISLRGESGSWLRSAIDHAPSDISPKALSDFILQESIARKGGSADDDMTVIVLRAAAAS